MDYVEGLDLYSLKAINKMENEFLCLCDFNLFVSAEMYTRYFSAIRELNNPLARGSTMIMKGKAFNRFKTQTNFEASPQFPPSPKMKAPSPKESKIKKAMKNFAPSPYKGGALRKEKEQQQH